MVARAALVSLGPEKGPASRYSLQVLLLGCVVE